jgi:hypothetical protein
LSQSTRARVGVELQRAECGGAFKAKAVLKSADLCTLYQFTHLNSDSYVDLDWLLNMKVIDLRTERKTTDHICTMVFALNLHSVCIKNSDIYIAMYYSG